MRKTVLTFFILSSFFVVSTTSFANDGVNQHTIELQQTNELPSVVQQQPDEQFDNNTSDEVPAQSSESTGVNLIMHSTAEQKPSTQDNSESKGQDAKKQNFSLLQLNLGGELLEPLIGNVQVSLLSGSSEKDSNGEKQAKFGLLEIDVKQSPIVGSVNANVLNGEMHASASTSENSFTGGLISTKIDNPIVGTASVGLLDGKHHESKDGFYSHSSLANIQLQNDIVGNVALGLGNASQVETDQYTQNNFDLLQLGTEKLPVVGEISIEVGVGSVKETPQSPLEEVEIPEVPSEPEHPTFPQEEPKEIETPQLQEEPMKSDQNVNNVPVNVEIGQQQNPEPLATPIENHSLPIGTEQPSKIRTADQVEPVMVEEQKASIDLDVNPFNEVLVPSNAEVNEGLFTNNADDQHVQFSSTIVESIPTEDETKKLSFFNVAMPASQGATTIISTGQATSSIAGYSLAETITAFIETVNGMESAHYFKWLQTQDELKTKWLKSPLIKPPEWTFSFLK